MSVAIQVPSVWSLELGTVGTVAVTVDRFIFIKCDVLETLRELLRELGVLEQHEG